MHVNQLYNMHVSVVNAHGAIYQHWLMKYKNVHVHVYYMYSRRHNKVSVPFLLPFRFLVVLPFLLPFVTVYNRSVF